MSEIRNVPPAEISPTRSDRVVAPPRSPATRVSTGRHWSDWINVAAGIWLFLSPWFVLSTPTGAWNAWIFGVIIAVLGFVAMSNARAEWGNVAAGVWLFVAPWVLGLVIPMAWNHWIVGALVTIVALAGATRTERHEVVLT